MRESRGFSLAARCHSIACALRGIRDMLRSHHNARIHAAATLAVVLTGWRVGLTASEWGLVMVAIVTVWVAEAINTALEYLTDIASPDQHPVAGKAKDAAAAAVLIASFGAALIGLLVFGPRLVNLWQS